MESTESKLLVTLVGIVLLISGVAWLNFFPVGGLFTALLGLVTLVWAFNLFVFHRPRGGRQA
jgi:hypothetical protein